MLHIKIFDIQTDRIKHNIPNVNDNQYREIRSYIERTLGNSMFTNGYEGICPYILNIMDQNSGFNILSKNINQDTYDIILSFLLGEHGIHIGDKSKRFGSYSTRSHLNYGNKHW